MSIKQFFAKSKLKNQLMRAFKAGGIYKETKTESKTYKRYPTIRECHIDEQNKAIRFTFTIPNGLNPDTITKQEWLFTQHFGGIHEIKTFQEKKFILWIYSNESTSFSFNYDDFIIKANKLQVPMIIGKDLHGKFHMYDMVTNPHLLVMGETGSGKSVYIRSVITFLSVYLRGRVEFYLADMKRTEFFLFKDLDNVKCNVTTKQELLFNLGRIICELERRGDLFNKAEVAHIEDYNKTVEKKLPFIMLCIDEVALLKKEKHIMDAIEQISCIGRSLGCFMILSMQRGDSKILDGNLKNNLTCRNVFRTADKINSDIGLGRKSEEDASQIAPSEKGRSYFKSEKTVLMQAPLLELEDAKELLKPFKVERIVKEEKVEDLIENVKPLEGNFFE